MCLARVRNKCRIPDALGSRVCEHTAHSKVVKFALVASRSKKETRRKHYMDSGDKLSPKEAAVIAEYQKLVANLSTINSRVTTLAHMPTSQVLDNLRVVERKTGLVFTLFKSSVWAILADLPGEQPDEGDD